MVLKNTINTDNSEIEEIAKSSYDVCMKLTVRLLLHLEKYDILQILNQLVMTRLKFRVWKGLVEYWIAICDQRMKT